VRDPEPPKAGDQLSKIENVILTPHIAGSSTVNGRHQQGKFIIEQVRKIFDGEALDYEVTEKMFSSMA
jgi:phosphoglycerate dehydrogenase-like enzyme